MSSGPTLIVLGVDLATEPRTTGAVRLVVGGGRATTEVIAGKLDDDRLVELATDVDVVGFDSPLGWPDAFVDAIAGHHRLGNWPETADSTEQRRVLSKRATDRFVKEHEGLDVLSVSADRIGAVAMRAGRLQALLAEVWGSPACRDGSGRLVETYPAAALKRWGLQHRAYKGSGREDLRRAILTELAAAASWLDLGGVFERCCASDHELDAVMCALIGLATRLGATSGPSNALEQDAAPREGWIHVPSVSLAELGVLVSGA